jgi:saccharopine dehydrogenase-like NADP-dependent oxidoreductase
MRIVVLGGAGNMGCISVQALAGDKRVDEVVIADINTAQAKTVADYIKSKKIKIVGVDLNKKDEFVQVLKGAGACLNATTFYTNLLAMDACLAAGVHYTDMGGLFHITRKQLELHDKFAKAKISAVLGVGSAPGIPNIQSRYAADRLDTIESIRIYDGIKPPSPDNLNFTYAIPTIVDELTVEPMVFADGEFRAVEPLTGFEDYLFIPPLGLLPMHYSLHSEVATLPISFKDKGIKECFFKINYWGMAKETVEKVRVLADFGLASSEPIEVKGQTVVPRDLLMSLLADYVAPVTSFLEPPKAKPPEWSKEIVTEIRGTKNGEKVLYRMGTLTTKGALPTGVVPAITAIWLAQGKVEPGVYPAEIAFDPEPIFKELEPYDIITQVTVTNKI